MTCLVALLAFLGAHSFEDPKLGWVLTDSKSWGYTWVQYQKEGDPKEVHRLHYFAFNHGPDDADTSHFTKKGMCKLQSGKEVPILEFNGKLDDREGLND